MTWIIKRIKGNREEFEAELDNLVERALMSSCNLANPREAEPDDYREIMVLAFEAVEKDLGS